MKDDEVIVTLTGYIAFKHLNLKLLRDYCVCLYKQIIILLKRTVHVEIRFVIHFQKKKTY